MIALLLALSAPGHAEAVRSGTVRVSVDDAVVDLPMVSTEVRADIHGDLATVRLTQTFDNPTDRPLDATYAFPLPADAAVHDMEVVAGALRVVAEIHRAEEARAIFDAADARGEQAALLTQHRPNVFTQDIANLPPGEPIRVSLTYVHPVPKADGAFSWTFPVAVGPRYLPATRTHPGEPEPLDIGAWNVPSPPADRPLPARIEAGRLAVGVALHAGAPIAALSVPGHPTARVAGDDRTRTVHLSGPLANRDVEVRYALADDDVAVATTAWATGGHGVVSLLIDPPAAVDAGRLTPRELVFVLDTSGSMAGPPLDAVKRFMHRALDTLRPGDHFRMVRFSHGATSFRGGAIPYNPETADEAHRWIDALEARGGTEMRTGVRAALDPAPVPGALRTVVFLTDGYIGNDVDVVRLVEARLGEARLFSFGVGASVNRWLLEELARVGHGVARVVTDPARAPDAADRLAERLAAPYLTDLSIDWGDAPIREATPARLPDLFLGEPIRVLAKFDRPGTWDVAITGNLAGARATLPVRLALPEEAPGAEALPVVWARSQVADRMHRYQSPWTTEAERRALREEVAVLGLEHRLVTRWTSFVAVVPEPEVAASDPNPAPAQHAAPTATPAPTASWGGSAAPEPAGWAALALLAAMGSVAGRRRTRGARTRGVSQ